MREDCGKGRGKRIIVKTATGMDDTDITARLTAKRGANDRLQEFCRMVLEGKISNVVLDGKMYRIRMEERVP